MFLLKRDMALLC